MYSSRRFFSSSLISTSILGLLAFLGASQCSYASPIQYQNTGLYFDVINPGERLTWEQANLAAQALSYAGVQGRLANPKDAALDAFIISIFDVFNPHNPNNSTFFSFGTGPIFGPWIGLHTIGDDATDLSSYRWSDGSIFDPDFYSGFPSLLEPNGDGSPGVDYLSFGAGRLGWNDEGCQLECGGPTAFIVEYNTKVPEPSSLLLFLAGIMLMVMKYRKS